MLTLSNERGKAGAELRAYKEGPALILGDKQGDNRAVLTLREDNPQLYFRNAQGSVLWRVP